MTKNLPAFPSVMPGGELVPHLSARYRRQQMDALYEATGGFDRALAHIEKNDENYARFLELYFKGQAKAVSVEHSADGDLADVIKKLDEEDRFKNAKVIEGTVTDVESC